LRIVRGRIWGAASEAIRGRGERLDRRSKMLEQPSVRRSGVHTRHCMGWRPRRGGGVFIPTLGGSVVGGWYATFGEQDIASTQRIAVRDHRTLTGV